MPTSTSNPPTATCYKFTVANAHEAAQVIRERLGEGARVLSVRTVEPSGLRGLFGSPKLEVIASVDAAPAAVDARSSVVGADLGRSNADENRPEQARPLHLTSDEAATPVAPARPEMIAHTSTRLRATRPARQELSPLLRRSGFSEAIVSMLERSASWAELQSLPLHRALVETGRHMQEIASVRPPTEPLTRAAFIGLAGSGRTTALCKWLSTEVGRRARTGHVVTAEFDAPVSRGPLPVFCEAMGVPMAHFPASTRPATAGGFVYFDLPAMSLRDSSANVPLAEFLDREQIEQRVLVLNAAYGHAALRAGYARGRELGATHVVFTHLDEVAQWGGLWDYLIDGGLEPLFLATGPSLTSECEEEVFDALTRRTLPVADDRAPTTREDAA
jgi:flagellar biosynthesis protein FlhF